MQREKEVLPFCPCTSLLHMYQSAIWFDDSSTAPPTLPHRDHRYHHPFKISTMSSQQPPPPKGHSQMIALPGRATPHERWRLAMWWRLAVRWGLFGAGVAGSQPAALFTPANCFFTSRMHAGFPQNSSVEIPLQNNSVFWQFCTKA